jgi:tetratricopeptide (TPR) repeat protein
LKARGTSPRLASPHERRLPLRRIALVPLVVCAAVSPVFAQENWRAGYVIDKTTGQKIEGKILDKGDLIVVDKDGKGTVKLEFDPANVKITYTDDGGAQNDPTPANAKHRIVEIEKTDGSVISGEVVEERADTVTIKPRGQSDPIVIKRSDIKRNTTIGDATTATEPDLDVYPDFDGRFVVEKPGPDWKIRKSTSPEVRVLASLTGKDAFMTVSARVLETVPPPYLDVNRENARKLSALVDAELKADLEKVGGLICDVGEIFGTPVYESRFEASYPSETTLYQFIELRFARDGILYVVRAGAEKKIYKELEPRLRDALQSFSFLPAIGGDEESYTDLIKGFGITRPSTKWVISARPFDDKEPVTMKNEDGNAQIHLVTVDAAGKQPADYVKELQAKINKNEGFQAHDQKNSSRSGATVEIYDWEYYERGSAQKREFQGIVAVVNDRIIHVEGSSPMSDVAARQLQQEVGRVLENLKFIDPRRSRERLANAAKAIEELGKGLDAQKKKNSLDAVASFTNAIKLYQDFARAYYLRATAYLDTKSWKEFRADIDKVTELDPRPESLARAAQLFLQQAQALQKDKQFPEACKAWKDVLAKDPKNDKLKKDFLKFFDDWWTEAKKVPAKEIKEKVEELEEHKINDKEFDQHFANIIADGGSIVLTADRKQYGKAKSLAQKALGYDRDCAKAKDLIKQCEEAKKQADAAQPKKK